MMGVIGEGIELGERAGCGDASSIDSWVSE